MANIPSVAKRARQADKRRAHNATFRAKLRTAKKRFLALLAAKDVEGVKASTPSLLQLLDKMVTKGIIHKNNAARNKSRTLAKARALVPDLELPKLTGLKVVAAPAKAPKVEKAPEPETIKKTAAKKAEVKKSTAKKSTTKKATESKAKSKKTSKTKED
tara:strand:- start:3234 stop:3710 length:477 start_codon:yes stop_codon:yes gene_type:complete